MARGVSPITWSNVAAPTGGAALSAFNQAGQNLGNAISGVGDSLKTGAQDYADSQTADFLNDLNAERDPAVRQQMIDASSAFLDNQQVNAAQTANLKEDRTATLFDNAVADRTRNQARQDVENTQNDATNAFNVSQQPLKAATNALNLKVATANFNESERQKKESTARFEKLVGRVASAPTQVASIDPKISSSALNAVMPNTAQGQNILDSNILQPDVDYSTQARPKQLNSPMPKQLPGGGTNFELYDALELHESGRDPNAVSPKGAFGLMQLMPKTAKDPGFNVEPLQNKSPEENRRLGRDYMDAMLHKYDNDLVSAIAGYNMGPTATDKWLKAGGDISKLNKETKGHITKITGTLGMPDPVSAAPTTAQIKADAQAALLPKPTGAALLNPNRLPFKDPAREAEVRTATAAKAKEYAAWAMQEAGYNASKTYNANELYKLREKAIKLVPGVERATSKEIINDFMGDTTDLASKETAQRATNVQSVNKMVADINGGASAMGTDIAAIHKATGTPLEVLGKARSAQVVQEAAQELITAMNRTVNGQTPFTTMEDGRKLITEKKGIPEYNKIFKSYTDKFPNVTKPQWDQMEEYLDSQLGVTAAKEQLKLKTANAKTVGTAQAAHDGKLAKAKGTQRLKHTAESVIEALDEEGDNLTRTTVNAIASDLQASPEWKKLPAEVQRSKWVIFEALKMGSLNENILGPDDIEIDVPLKWHTYFDQEKTEGKTSFTTKMYDRVKTLVSIHNNANRGYVGIGGKSVDLAGSIFR